MYAPRIIELSFAVLVAFLFLVLVSFFTTRPMLNNAKSEAWSLWDEFRGSVSHRNESLLGLIEGAKGILPGSGQLIDKLLAVRAVSLRTTDPDEVIASVDAMEEHLKELERWLSSNPDLAGHPTFLMQWKNVQALTNRINALRHEYSIAARSYNTLLSAFPQNLVAAAFGFLPLKSYRNLKTAGAEDEREGLVAVSTPPMMATALSTKRNIDGRAAVALQTWKY